VLATDWRAASYLAGVVTGYHQGALSVTVVDGALNERDLATGGRFSDRVGVCPGSGQVPAIIFGGWVASQAYPPADMSGGCLVPTSLGPDAVGVSLVATMLSAAAATTAAILTGVNLYLSRQREDVKWARNVLIDTLGQFLDASFRSKDAVKKAYKISQSGMDQSQIAALKQEALRAEEEMRTLQTRLRLLGSAELVEAAQSLRTGIRAYVAVLDQQDPIPVYVDRQLRRSLWDGRDAFVMAARKTLSI
jgi:hypothetical protein